MTHVNFKNINLKNDGILSFALLKQVGGVAMGSPLDPI